MMYTVECFKKKRGESLWRIVGESESYGAAAELFDETCARNEGCAVIMRGEMGEVIVKRSVLPEEVGGGS